MALRTDRMTKAMILVYRNPRGLQVLNQVAGAASSRDQQPNHLE